MKMHGLTNPKANEHLDLIKSGEALNQLSRRTNGNARDGLHLSVKEMKHVVLWRVIRSYVSFTSWADAIASEKHCARSLVSFPNLETIHHCKERR